MSPVTSLSELTGDYVLDPARSRIGFVARHTMGTRVRGRFEDVAGVAHLSGDDPSRSSVELMIQAASIQTRNRQRDTYLRRRFLETDTHPVLTFTSTEVRQVDSTTFQLIGDLTIRAVTRPVAVDLTLAGAEHDAEGTLRVGVVGGATIRRRDWGVNWNALTRAMVGDTVTLEFDVTAICQS